MASLWCGVKIVRKSPAPLASCCKFQMFSAVRYAAPVLLDRSQLPVRADHINTLIRVATVSSRLAVLTLVMVVRHFEVLWKILRF